MVGPGSLLHKSLVHILHTNALCAIPAPRRFTLVSRTRIPKKARNTAIFSLPTRIPGSWPRPFVGGPPHFVGAQFLGMSFVRPAQSQRLILYENECRRFRFMRMGSHPALSGLPFQPAQSQSIIGLFIS